MSFLPSLGDRSRHEPEVVVSWGDSQAAEVDYLPAPPVVAGVGLRPEQLTDLGRRIFFADNLEWYDYMQRRLTRLAATALRVHRAREVVSSLALGWDTALAEAAEGLRLPYRIVLPFRGLQSRWHGYHRERFSRLLGKASEVEVLAEGGYTPWKLKQALIYRVEHSDLILTLWDEADADTHEVMLVAHRLEKEVINLWASWLRYGGLKEERPSPR